MCREAIVKVAENAKTYAPANALWGTTIASCFAGIAHLSCIAGVHFSRSCSHKLKHKGSACRAGQEVTISYGSWPNDVFLLFFGFMPEGNEHDAVVLFHTLPDLVACYNIMLQQPDMVQQQNQTASAEQLDLQQSSTAQQELHQQGVTQQHSEAQPAGTEGSFNETPLSQQASSHLSNNASHSPSQGIAVSSPRQSFTLKL